MKKKGKREGNFSSSSFHPQQQSPRTGAQLAAPYEFLDKLQPVADKALFRA
jgi:hypothetical protein